MVLTAKLVFAVEPTYTYQARTTGYRSRFWDGSTFAASQHQTRNQQGTNYDRYTGGMSEEEQLAQAVRESQQQRMFYMDCSPTF